jgi:NitT/TauT family transport system substrate-binding protein
MSTPIQRRDFLLGTAALGGGLTLWSIAAQGAKTVPITAAHSVNTAIYAAHMVALGQGFMEEEGLTMHLIEALGGSNVRRILAAGQVGYALGDSGHPIQLSSRGKPAKMLMATDNRCSYANIIVRKELFDQGIDSVEKLSEHKRDGGKPVIAATGIGSGTWLYGTYVLEQAGVNDKFNWVGGGGSKTMLGGLKTGQFDAIMAVPAWQFEAEDNGYGKAIYDVADQASWDKVFGGNIPTTVIYVLETAILDNAELTQKYVNAMFRSMQWLKDHSTDEIYGVIGEKYMGRFDPALVKREIDYYKAMWQYDGSIAEADFANGGKVWFREGTKMEKAGYADLVDTQFLEAAQKKYG